jgi:hypothetical protein
VKCACPVECEHYSIGTCPVECEKLLHREPISLGPDQSNKPEKPNRPDRVRLKKARGSYI